MTPATGLPAVLLLAFSFSAASVASAQSGTFSVSGSVRDQTGSAVAGADVALKTAERRVVATEQTNEQGEFALPNIPRGHYLLEVTASGFGVHRLNVPVRDADVLGLEVLLSLGAIHEELTVTAEAGSVLDSSTAVQSVTRIGAQEIQERAKSVVAQVANESVGVALQRTSPTLAGIYVRGLTGKNVNIYVDGVRYSTSAQRGGINTFLDLMDPSSLEAVEILRGPNSAQYGSDSLGGSVQFLSKSPAFSPTGSAAWRGSAGTSFNSADLGYGTDLSVIYAGDRVGVMASIAGRRVNELRTGEGLDSHNAFTRFFGLPSTTIIEGRLPDTDFTQFGGLLKANWMPTASSQVSFSYTRGQQEGGKRYDQLIGGDGNLIADLRDLTLDLGTIRYERGATGWFDRMTATYSINSQREERVNQGGSGNPRAAITHEPERATVNGAQISAGRQIGNRHNLLVGGEFYAEHMDAESFAVDPVTGATTIRRGRIPDNARYRSGGVYVQDSIDAGSSLRFVGNLRVGGASYKAQAADAPVVGGVPLWPDDALDVGSVTFRAGAIVSPAQHFTISGFVSRGFRAPHVTDLGTLGLTGSGFEVAAPDVAGLNGTIGNSASAAAVSTGRPVEQLKPETSLNYDLALRFRSGPVSTDLTVFVNDISDNIQKQALILPPGAVGQVLGDTPIIAQNANGAVFVAASTAPVLVRSNYDEARIRGVEHTFGWRVSQRLSFSSVLTYIHAHDKTTGLAPNIEGGTPAPDGYLKVRYAQPGGGYWLEPFLHIAAKQSRLSTLDLEDRRTGATRTRTSIRNFFINGATARGYVAPGPDGAFGTADDLLRATGETLAAIQDRVLGVGVAGAPLFTSVPGYVTVNVRGGLRFGAHHEVMMELENLTDENYRGISWGIDAPGRALSMRYRASF